MIIRSNLASAPIKNYSLYLLGCAALGAIVILFTIWNFASLKNSYSSSSELKRSIASQQSQLKNLEDKGKVLQSEITRIKTPGFVAETEFMNNAIKRRTFSWTALFDHFEDVLPPNVKMISISPTVAEKDIAINLELAGQSLADMLELVRLLERDPAFSQVVLKGENTGEAEQIFFTISLNYIPIGETKPDTDLTANPESLSGLNANRAEATAEAVEKFRLFSTASAFPAAGGTR